MPLQQTLVNCIAQNIVLVYANKLDPWNYFGFHKSIIRSYCHSWTTAQTFGATFNAFWWSRANSLDGPVCAIKALQYARFHSSILWTLDLKVWPAGDTFFRQLKQVFFLVFSERLLFSRNSICSSQHTNHRSMARYIDTASLTVMFPSYINDLQQDRVAHTSILTYV